MKFNCNQQELLKKINIVSKAVSTRTTIPTLKGILLSLNDGILKMTASDLDITIETSLFVDQKEPGNVVVPAKILSDIIRKLQNTEIEITEENNNIGIKCGTYNTSIVGMDASEFPVIKDNEEDMKTSILEKNLLNEMIRKTAFAASIDQTKGVITGVLIEKKKEYIRMAAIDGFRMAIATEDEPGNDEENIIISAKLMNEISKIISDSSLEENNITINYSENAALFEIDNTRISIRLLAGEFIKYNDVIPKENPIEVKLRKEDLIGAVDRAAILSEGRNNLVKFAFKENIMTISSNSEEGGSVEDIIVSKTGDDIEIGFNARYIIDALKVIEDEEIIMKMNTPITPCIITPVEGERFTYLILPVRINNM